MLVGTCHEDDEGAEEGDNTADDYVSRNTPHLDAMRKAAGLEGKMTYDPCISRQTPLYMKRPDVLKALHAETHPNPVRKTAPPPPCPHSFHHTIHRPEPVSPNRRFKN
eukprot:COSAG06_NODE_689_length_13068_cov_9.661269_19_plen_108_part_00